MSAAGIIAEYNPFHRGHQYQIGQIRRTLGAQYVIVVMSGDFVQRGAPALLSKYERTRMALLGGADESAYMEEFIPAAVEEDPNEEVIVTDEFELPSDE